MHNLVLSALGTESLVYTNSSNNVGSLLANIMQINFF